jgi:hypothetical protein
MLVRLQPRWPALPECLQPVPDGVRIAIKRLGDVLLRPPLGQQPNGVPSLTLARPWRLVHAPTYLPHIELPRLQHPGGIHATLPRRRLAHSAHFVAGVYRRR